MVPGASMHEDELAELAARRERVVGGFGVVQRERPLDRHADPARRDERQHVPLEPAHDQRLLLERARAQRRGVDPAAGSHQRAEVDLGTRARARSDHEQPAAGREQLEVPLQQLAADQLEDHVVRALDLRVGPERAQLLVAVPARWRSRARRADTPSCTAATPDAAGRAVHEQPLARSQPGLREERIVRRRVHLDEPARGGPVQRRRAPAGRAARARPPARHARRRRAAPSPGRRPRSGTRSARPPATSPAHSSPGTSCGASRGGG